MIPMVAITVLLALSISIIFYWALTFLGFSALIFDVTSFYV